MSEEKGFVLNSKNLSVGLTILTILVIIYSALTTMNNYYFKVDNLETQVREFSTQVNNLNGKLDLLSNKITDLTVSLARLETRNNIENK